MKIARLPAMNVKAKDRGNLPQKRRIKSGIPATTLFVLALVSGASGVDCTVATSFDRDFPDKWIHARSLAAPGLSNRDTVYAGISWRIHAFFKEYARDYSGNVDLSFSYKIVKPDGALFFDTTGIQAVSGVVANDNALLLSYRIPIVSFSRKDMPGKYRLIVTAEDRVAKTKITREKAIVLSKYPKTAPTDFTDISFNVWVHSYCLNPDPGRALSAFSCFIGSKMSDNNDIFWPVFYFFQCLFGDNPALVQKLAATIPGSSDRLRDYTVFLLRAIQCRKSDIEYPIPDSLWKKFDRAAATGFYDPFTDAFLAKSNRFMEFAFYCHGQYSMVRFLVDCLGVNTPAGYESFRKHCKQYSGACPDSLDRETALRFRTDAKRILEKTCALHPLVNAYCNYAFENDVVAVDAGKALGEIIASSKK